MEGPALRTGLGGFRGALHGRLGQPSSGEPRLITPGASLAGGDQEQSKCQTAARSHPSGAIRLSPLLQGAPGALAKFRSWTADSEAQRISLLLTPSSCG